MPKIPCTRVSLRNQCPLQPVFRPPPPSRIIILFPAISSLFSPPSAHFAMSTCVCPRTFSATSSVPSSFLPSFLPSALHCLGGLLTRRKQQRQKKPPRCERGWQKREKDWREETQDDDEVEVAIWNELRQGGDLSRGHTFGDGGMEGESPHVRAHAQRRRLYMCSTGEGRQGRERERAGIPKDTEMMLLRLQWLAKACVHV